MMFLVPCAFDTRLFVVLLSTVALIRVAAFDITRYDNVASYWGQNSYGATHATDTANFQQPLGYYCQDDAVDVFPVAFLDVFFGTGGLPSINLANTCNPTDNTTFSGTDLPDCSALASDIETCQSMGKIVTISLGGATGSDTFTSDSQAETFAQTIWDLFLGGNSTTRPFGTAVLDGVDLDIEEGGGTSLTAFVNQLRTLYDGGSKTYYVSAAPQCPYPLSTVLDASYFDAVYVQFYNNVCGLQNYDTVSDWDFGVWDNWARTTSINPNVKIYLGAPASSTAAGTGYQSISNLSSIAVTMRESFPSWGGVMLWDESQAYVNDRYDLAIKTALVAAGGTGFTYPACSAPAYVAGTAYTGGSQVSFDGYIWEAKWYASDQPSNDPNGDWSAISACSGSGASVSSTSASSSSTTTSAATSTTVTASSPTSTSSYTSSYTSTSASATPTSGGTCAGIAAWSNSVAYTAGEQVVYSGDLWTANWWTEDDTPGGDAGSWTEEGACS